MTSTSAQPSPGTTLAGYRIERPLGHGGMGTVYFSRNAADAPVALKVVELGGDNSDLGRLFEREVATGRRLDHPGIVRILEAGRSGDLGFIAMEFVDGESLDHFRATRHPVPVAVALGIAAMVARALEHAHEAGVLHRDVKPANILVEHGTHSIKLADFGLARLADLQRSRTGVLAGTPAYMSPEQLAEGPLDGRADLYSLGVVLFELLTGRLPHEAHSLGALLRQVSQIPAPSVQSLRPDVPPTVSSLVARLLEKRPADRPPSARALAEALELMGSGAPQQTVPVRPPVQPV